MNFLCIRSVVILMRFKGRLPAKDGESRLRVEHRPLPWWMCACYSNFGDRAVLERVMIRLPDPPASNLSLSSGLYASGGTRE